MLGLGIELAGDDTQLGPGLQDPHPGNPERQVLPVGGVDELVEGRIFECLPPVFVFCRRGLDSLVTGVHPGLLHLDRRAHVVGPHHGAAQDQHGQAGGQPNQPAYPAGAGFIAVSVRWWFAKSGRHFLSGPRGFLPPPNFCPSAPDRQAAQVKAISRGEILLRLIVWHIRPKLQGKNGAAAMILCAGERLTEAGSILI